MSRLAAVCTLVLLAAACAASSITSAPLRSTSAPPSRGVTAAPPAFATARPSETCEALLADATTAPWEIAYLSHSTAVVIARVDAVGPARWTTSDGRQPDDPGDGNDQIVTPVALELADSITGSLRPGQLRVHLLGGTVGCSSLRVNGVPEPALVVGRRYAFFLDGVTADWAEYEGLSPRIFDAWEVDTADIVHTRWEGDIPLASFRAAVMAAAGLTPLRTD